jgi:hypothetical protein
MRTPLYVAAASPGVCDDGPRGRHRIRRAPRAAGRRGALRVAQHVRVHGVPRRRTRGGDGHRRPRRRRAGRCVVLRRAPARRDAPPHPVDEDPPAGIRAVGAIHRACRRGGHDPRVRTARVFTALLLGGRNRRLADHVAGHLRPKLPAYDIITDVERIPPDLRGMHAANPVNLPRSGGVQIELPPRARGSSPLWWDWEGGLVPHTEALIAGLADAAIAWPSASSASPAASGGS